MSSPRYNVKILQGEELQGLTGEYGERYCVFVRDLVNPLNSLWKWYATEEEAKRLEAALVKKLAEGGA